MSEAQNAQVTILIPTYDNPNFITQCVNSILMHTVCRDLVKVVVINNGNKEIENFLTKHPMVKLIHADKNLGWEGGLKLGMEHVDTPFVCFMNDDAYVPYSSNQWIIRCLAEFRNKDVAAVGPTSNVVRGAQNIFLDQFGGYQAPYAPFLIGFCVFVRMSDLMAAGGIDDTLPGGDDFDLSIRLRKLGKKLVICRDVFIFHHGFKTGERVRGTPDRPGGWNSQDMSENTNIALIKKHGFREFINCNYGACETPNDARKPSRKNEAEVVKRFVKPGVIYDFGCGSSKTVDEAIGVDRVPKGGAITYLGGEMSCADITADVAGDIPIPDESGDTIITRHILEHVIDPITVLKNWAKKLKKDGRMIVAVPDERIGMTIPMNPEHRHAYTPESFRVLANTVGLKEVGFADDYNGISFIMVLEKNGQN